MIGYREVEEGLRKRELFLEYLPIVDMNTGRCVGAEALIRWRREGGIVQPPDFIPIVENTHLAGELTYYVLEEIAGELLDWLKEHDAFISFNVSPEIIGRGGLAYVAKATGLIDIKDKLVIEIVERGVPDQMGIDSLNHAAERGIRIALDDIGTAGANLIVLSRCNVEMVKFDPRLVSEVRKGEPLPGGLDAISPLLKAGKLTAVAEGVESAEQIEVLTTAGVRLAQGYYFSKPISASEFKVFFDRYALSNTEASP